MTSRWTRLAGVGLLAACGLWARVAAGEVSSVAPAHWPMLLPWLTLAGIPALVGTFTATALIFGKPGARALTLAFVVTLAQAAMVAYVAPDIETQYEKVVEQGKQLIRDSLP